MTLRLLLLLSCLLALTGCVAANTCVVDSACKQVDLKLSAKSLKSRLFFITTANGVGKINHCYCVFQTPDRYWYVYDPAVGSQKIWLDNMNYDKDGFPEALALAKQITFEHLIDIAYYEKEL